MHNHIFYSILETLTEILQKLEASISRYDIYLVPYISRKLWATYIILKNEINAIEIKGNFTVMATNPEMIIKLC